MEELVTQLTTSIKDIDWSPLYAVMVSLLPTIITVRVGIEGLKRGVSFLLSNIFGF